MQVLLTAVNRKGLCVEEETSDDRKKQQIVVGLLVACTLRLVQRGPDLNVFGEVVELSAMVGSPISCNDFVQCKSYPSVGWQQPSQLDTAQQQHGTTTPSHGVPQSLSCYSQPPDDKQQQLQGDDGLVLLCNFPDVLEGYGGALLLPNLQQRTDCLLSLASSTATISGEPGLDHQLCLHAKPFCPSTNVQRRNHLALSAVFVNI